ncbi:hypothetical protein EYZ11_011704 [Aspergillus tanneri]|uniref:Uncharacterized protein n=1 Tax=Aspergillus tanneri TaxID=1220188 RepID=A0A4S3J245_9EURO|nr:hypothetical protein EYZ11_011704 [Aspergillus tanneri]
MVHCTTRFIPHLVGRDINLDNRLIIRRGAKRQSFRGCDIKVSAGFESGDYVYDAGDQWAHIFGNASSR